MVSRTWIRIFLSVIGISLLSDMPDVNAAGASQERARELVSASGVHGGVIVHVGCNDGRLTASLLVNDSFTVQGLDTDEADVASARQQIQRLGRYGNVSIDQFDGKRLPYIDNLVNLIIVDERAELSLAELERVLCPAGVALVSGATDRADVESIVIGDRMWSKIVKPRPSTIDDWTHYLYDASNNAVANDSEVGPPRRMQWVGGPRYSRHHDHMSSLSAAVSAGNRVFYIFDEASPLSVLLPPKWTLVARDAFNGTILWKRDISHWHSHLWRLKSGPAQLPRRLVASADRVYVTLGLDAPLVALDAATGETVHTFPMTKATEEVILCDDVLFALVNDDADKPDYDGSERAPKSYGAKFWDEKPRKVVALDVKTGKALWSEQWHVLPGTMAADSKRVVFHDGENVICLDRSTGKEAWRSQTIARSEDILGFYIPILVLYNDVVLFSGGETAGKQTGSWYEEGEDTMTGLDAETGMVLWSAYHPPSGYRSPEDMLVVDGLVWTGETTSGRAEGLFTGRDPKSGEVKREFTPNVDTYWFHHRCYRSKATSKYLLVSRTGIEFLDVKEKAWDANHWVRGSCLYGIMPANGLVYAPQHPCACYLEAKMFGFNALAPAGEPRSLDLAADDKTRLTRGPAFGDLQSASSDAAPSNEWPTYRHDAARSGVTKVSVPTNVAQAWQTDLGGKLSSPVISGGRVLVASIDAHTVHAVDATSGKKLWQYTTGGRVDSPPTVYKGMVLFGSADGCVYALRATDGALVWRFRAAPVNERLMSFEQLESVWPVHGNVLVQDDAAYFASGRSMFLDGGICLWRLNPVTGQILSSTVMDESDPEAHKKLQDYVSWLNMPAALPDVLSSDGRLVYMRSQPFNLDGTRLPLEAMPREADADKGAPPAAQRRDHAHLFCPTGFLDDTWWHRTYWMYGSRFVSGWCGYFRAGKTTPAGRLLVFDDSKIYGFGRKPKYFRWTTPLEHHVFSADKQPPLMPEATEDGPTGTMIQVEKSPSLNLANKPVTVEAWVKAEKSSGVVLARGGSGQGYALYLNNGRPHFVIRANGKANVVAATQRIVGRWTHLAGVLTSEKDLQVYINGQLAKSIKVAGLIPADPLEAIEIGADDASSVGDYNAPFGFTGAIDEVRVYTRALSANELRSRAAGTVDPDRNGIGLVLACCFDRGDASDTSGQ